MAQPYSTRDDIKRDPLQEYFKIALEWIAANRQTFFSVVGVTVTALVVGAFILTNLRHLRMEAWQRYDMGQTWAATNNPDNALKAFDDVISNYGHTPAATFALLAKGDVLYQQKRTKDAVEAYRQCIAKNPPKSVMPFALAAMGAAQEDSGDFSGAVESYKQFTANYPDHMLAPKIYESLARAYELSHNPDAAKEVYEKIITMFPESLWSQKARLRYQTLAPQPFQNSPEANQPPPGAPH